MGDGLQANEAEDLLRQFGGSTSDTRQVCYESTKLLRFYNFANLLAFVDAIMKL